MSRRAKVAIIAALLLIAYLWFTWWLLCVPPPKAERLPEWTPAEKRWVKERMKYHGIDGCIRDADGYYFIRAGKRCRL